MTLASRSAQRGYTLTELMVVVLIMVIMMALALPAVRRASEDARVRESSRQVQAFFTMAKARAAATGRIAGVEFVVQKGVNDSPFATQMYLCESPNLYGGAFSNSLAKASGSNLIFSTSASATSSDAGETAILDSLIASGEGFFIRFNFRGEWYAAARNGSAYSLLVGYSVAPPSQGVPFQIRRAPVRVGNPSELPAGTVVDLAYSGVGITGTDFSPAANFVRVIFAPEGNVALLNYQRRDAMNMLITQSDAPSSGLFFLVGQSIKVGSRGQDLADPRNSSNLAEGTNLWVSVGRLTGAVATSENVVNASRETDATNYPIDLRTARQFAINREQMKGK